VPSSVGAASVGQVPSTPTIASRSAGVTDSPVLRLDRDLPGDVGGVRRQPCGGFPVAVGLVRRAVDREQLERIVRELLPAGGGPAGQPFCQESDKATTRSIWTAVASDFGERDLPAGVRVGQGAGKHGAAAGAQRDTGQVAGQDVAGGAADGPLGPAVAELGRE
jgi:hypothetical protein